MCEGDPDAGEEGPATALCRVRTEPEEVTILLGFAFDEEEELGAGFESSFRIVVDGEIGARGWG